MISPYFLAFLAATAVQPEPPPAAPPTASVAANHLAIHVKDPEASARFYSDALGLKRMPIGSTPTIIWLNDGNFELHLVGGRTEPVGVPRQVHFALRVPDLAAVTARLDARNVAWGNFDGASRVSQKRSDGVLQIYFQDPDGYWIEVNQLPPH